MTHSPEKHGPVDRGTGRHTQPIQVAQHQPLPRNLHVRRSETRWQVDDAAVEMLTAIGLFALAAIVLAFLLVRFAV